MKGSAITGPVGKEAAELWPVRTISPHPPGSQRERNTELMDHQRIASNSGVVM